MWVMVSKSRWFFAGLFLSMARTIRKSPVAGGQKENCCLSSSFRFIFCPLYLKFDHFVRMECRNDHDDRFSSMLGDCFARHDLLALLPGPFQAQTERLLFKHGFSLSGSFHRWQEPRLTRNSRNALLAISVYTN